MTPEQITRTKARNDAESAAVATKARKDKIEYCVYMAINIIVLLGLLTFATFTIVKVFQGHANTALGFAILTVFLWWVFRHIPWPVSAVEKRRREIKALLEEISRFQ
jgi:hypothetical protein